MPDSIKYFQKVLSILLVFFLLLNYNTGIRAEKAEAGPNVAQQREEIRSKKNLFITVGSKDCEFASLKEALSAVDDTRKIIYLMDEVHTEYNIEIMENADIRGFGPQHTVIQASEDAPTAKGRVFLIGRNAAVSLTGLTIRHGRVDTVTRCGGGIFNKGTLTVKDCIISDNEATYGVGINNEGTIEITNSQIIRNKGLKRPVKDELGGVDCGGSGCGFKAESKSTAVIKGCLIAENVSVANGGGIHVSCEGKVTLENCTIAKNKAAAEGGGISVRGDLSITQCTVAENRSSKGGGIFAMGKVEMTGNLLAKNLPSDFAAGSGYGYYGKGIVDKNEYNLIADGKFKSYRKGDPGILTLADNGGPTMTYGLKASSIALNAIPEGKSSVDSDQRGNPRPDGARDIGAFEYSGFTLMNYLAVGAVLLIVSGLAAALFIFRRRKRNN